MKSIKKTILLLSIILVIAAGSIFIYLQLMHPQQKNIANQFLLSVLEDGNYQPYLLHQSKEHLFPLFLQEQSIKEFQVERVDSLGKRRSRVQVTAQFSAGRIPFHIDMAKYKNQWMITGLPNISYHTYGIPISERKMENAHSIWVIDLGEESIEMQALSTTEVRLGQPISFAAIDDLLAVVQPLQPVQLTKVLSLSNTVLEDETLGFFPIQGDFPIFLEKEAAYEFQGNFALSIGATEVILYRTEDGTCPMAIMKQPFANYHNIRVLLQTSGYSSLLHEKIEITSQESFDVYSIPNGLYLSFDSGETVEFRPNDQEEEVWYNGEKLASSLFRWHIRGKGEAPLYVKTIHRSQSNPSFGTPYPGTLEVAVLGDMLTLVNEVELEEYLKTVVPSEMPVMFGLQALKVQAVAARSYAARGIQSSGYRSYGAHLDDSVASQVYNNISEQEVASHSVKETMGMVAVYEEEIVDTRFFSTSSGYTANFHEVWSNQENEFPAEEVPYLTAIPQYAGKIPDLYREENFRAFLNQADLAGYDKFSPFFRWSVQMTREQLEAILSRSLPALYQQQSLFILTKSADGSYESREIPDDVGTLLNIEVLQRGEGGNMMELEITTTRGIFKIRKEYNIRKALEPVNLLGTHPMELYCHDGSTRENFPLLPSAFAYINFSRDTEGNVIELSIHGGGYGHGVGMSQYGTYGLTLLGRTWKDIIKHYYPGSELRSLYN